MSVTISDESDPKTKLEVFLVHNWKTIVGAVAGAVLFYASVQDVGRKVNEVSGVVDTSSKQAKENFDATTKQITALKEDTSKQLTEMKEDFGKLTRNTDRMQDKLDALRNDSTASQLDNKDQWTDIRGNKTALMLLGARVDVLEGRMNTGQVPPTRR